MTAPRILVQTFPDPLDLRAAVDHLRSYHGWTIELGKDDEDRGQGCKGLTLSIYPTNPDSYSGEALNTRFIYPVPAAAYNRESWEEWLWARIEETEGHERAENFVFVDESGTERRPFKPAHADGWDPGVVRAVVSETVTNTPNAGRLVTMPCICGHRHRARMGEHFAIGPVNRCDECPCTPEEWTAN